ncbi:unnamed protein product [Urochloa decumbens]|uniref:PDZ domain-containing protein n=1 Tax=Urochloa decumbens TaxID=240449 RepID=A0ABC9BE23_9POAL
MSANGGNPGPLAGASGEDSRDPGRPPNKRKKIEAGATEFVGGSNTDTEDVTQLRKTAAASPATVGGGSSSSPAVPVSTPPPRPRYPSYPKSGKSKDVRKWNEECRRIGEILAKDPRNDLPTQRKPKDPDTDEAVQSRRDKAVVRKAARSIVSVSSTGHGGVKIQQCSGIIIRQWEEEEKRVIIATCSNIVCSMGRLLDPVPKLYVGLPKKTIVEGQLLFVNHHYDIALLEITVDFPLQCPSIGSGPSYGQEVFLLSRDEESSLMARQGEILWLEESNYLGRNYQMFLSCEVPEGGNGGPVIDHDGNVTGMAFQHSPDPAVISISTVITCIEMWLKFRRIARPVHGLGVRTMELLNVSLQEEIYDDYDIDSGYIVDVVSYDSAAESLGVLPGDVIVSFDDRHDLTLPQLEDYLLSLGWQFLQNPSSTVYLKLEVYDLIRRSKRSITLPVGFCDTSEQV